MAFFPFFFYAVRNTDKKGSGTCLNWGCLPAKSLLYSAALFNKMKDAARRSFRRRVQTVLPMRSRRACSPETLPELLVPDFKGKEDALEKIAADRRFRFDTGAMPAPVR